MNAITVARFWSKVSVSKVDDCWEWQANRVNGYGRFGDERAHRVAYSLCVGEIPEQMCIRHKCDNPACVNPRHLEVGTIADNNRDTIARSRHVAPRSTANGRAKLTDSQVSEIRDSMESGAAIARRFGVSQGLVSMIRRGFRRAAGTAV